MSPRFGNCCSRKRVISITLKPSFPARYYYNGPLWQMTHIKMRLTHTCWLNGAIFSCMLVINQMPPHCHITNTLHATIYYSHCTMSYVPHWWTQSYIDKTLSISIYFYTFQLKSKIWYTCSVHVYTYPGKAKQNSIASMLYHSTIVYQCTTWCPCHINHT